MWQRLYKKQAIDKRNTERLYRRSMEYRRISERQIYAFLKQLVCVTIIIAFAMSMASCSNNPDWQEQRSKTAKYLLEQIDDGSLPIEDGEWALIGIKNSDVELTKDYLDNYYDSVRAKVKSKKGVLSEDFYTEYARTALGVFLAGKDPKSVEGYNLIEKLNDYGIVLDQGVNASIYALIASNYCGYKLNEESESKYLDDIRAAFEDGGEAVSSKVPMDYCGMALQALAYYKDDSTQKETINKIYELIEKKIKSEKNGVDLGSCESNAQVILGLSAMGIDLEKDKRFIRDEETLIDGIMKYAEEDGFAHIKGKKVNLLASQQALMALDSFVLAKDKKMLMPKNEI